MSHPKPTIIEGKLYKSRCHAARELGISDRKVRYAIFKNNGSLPCMASTAKFKKICVCCDNEKYMTNYQVLIHSKKSEFLVFLNSGGVIAKTFYVPLNDLFNKFFIWAFLYLVLCITFPRNFTDIDSRYFYYFSPFLIIIFSSVLVYSLEVIPNKILKKICFFILLIVLSIQSTLTIKVSMLRGKMSANRHIYDYVKFSKNISGILNNHKIKKIYVKNLPKLNLDKEQPENFFGKKFNNGELEFLTLKYILNQDYPKIKISENFTSSENTKIFDFNTVLKQDSFDYKCSHNQYQNHKIINKHLKNHYS